MLQESSVSMVTSDGGHSYSAL